MDLATLVQVLGPTGALLFLGLSGLKVFWPTYEKHMERRTVADEKQAQALERIADLSEQSLALQRDMDRKLDDQRIDLAVLLERRQIERPTRNRKLTAPTGASS